MAAFLSKYSFGADFPAGPTGKSAPIQYPAGHRNLIGVFALPINGLAFQTFLNKRRISDLKALQVQDSSLLLCFEANLRYMDSSMHKAAL